MPPHPCPLLRDEAARVQGGLTPQNLAAGDGVMEAQDLPREKTTTGVSFFTGNENDALNGRVLALATLIRVIGEACSEARTIPPFGSYHSLEKIGKCWRPGEEEGHRINLLHLPAQL